jgi:hypothetical protein
VSLADLGDAAPAGDVVVWDWRAGTATRTPADASWSCSLASEQWTFHVVAPVLTSGIAVIGDAGKFATAGDARVVVTELHDGVRVVVLGASETVMLTGWADHPPSRHASEADDVSDEGDDPDALVAFDATTGVWTTAVRVPPRGWTTLTMR